MRLAYGGEVADQVILSIFSALLWHTPQLREDVEKYGILFLALYVTCSIVRALVTYNVRQNAVVLSWLVSSNVPCANVSQSIP